MSSQRYGTISALEALRDALYKYTTTTTSTTWYDTSLGLAWDAMMKITGVTLYLLRDINMLHVIQNGIHGGTAMVSNCLGQGNNSTWVKITTVVNLWNIYNTLMQTTFMVGLCRNRYQPTDSSGWMKRNWKIGGALAFIRGRAGICWRSSRSS